jgi:hypothetical protein
MKPTTASIDALEQDVLRRIALHRAGGHNQLALSASTLLVITALTAGLVTGFGHAVQRNGTAAGSESIVLAESARIAPSDLLARVQ